MRVQILLRRHARSGQSTLVPELVTRLRDRGCRVSALDPDGTVLGLGEPLDLDLAVLQSGTEPALSYAGALSAAGVPVFNPYPVAAACRDKVVQTARLRTAGVRVPESWTTTQPVRLAELLRAGPLIVKDPRGSRGRGIHVVEHAASLAELEVGRPWLVMRYHRPDGPDLKLYRIGHEVFGVERPFPARTLREKLGRPVPVDPEIRDLVWRCGEAFGIEVYGVDVVFSRGRPWVVDMSAFPGFKGVPEAGVRIADHLLADGALLAADALERTAPEGISR